MKLIQRIPLAMSGLSLGLAALGNLLLPYGENIRTMLGILSFVALGLFIMKIMFDFDRVKEELENPIVHSILPTATMALMLLSVYIRPHFGTVAILIWYLAILIHIYIMITFVKKFIIQLKLKTVFPSWLIAGVGIVTISVTSPAMDATRLGQIVFYIGLAAYFVFLPIIIYRMIKIKELPEPAKPTIAIFTAPMSLCIVGYFAAFSEPNAFLVYMMSIIAVLSYLYVSIKMISLLQLKFYPTYAAFTFPYVISAIAFRLVNQFLINNAHHFFSPMVTISEWIAIIMVAYVFIRYIGFIFLPEKKGASLS